MNVYREYLNYANEKLTFTRNITRSSNFPVESCSAVC